ncbi:hypothetical protein [Neobacillus niacini]|uniref:hypothetical protein n=1 Tax=Neobacillus niacini TaxID=86668 RepID=UPI0021CB6E10|nr:hypothetical protein [Neobacillus niacini]MCM3763884.1 hypothetical protein [Neobacillus niacini]
MKRQIKFPLVIKSEQIRTIEDLRENFHLESVLDYFFDGRLKTWLEQRGYTEELNALPALTGKDDNEDIPKILSELFGVDYNQDFNFKKYLWDREKIALIKQFTDSEQILKDLDRVITTQEELNQLTAKGNQTVYLLGHSFLIKNGVEKTKYIGINQPRVKLIHNLDYYSAKNIEFHDVILDFSLYRLMEKIKPEWDEFAKSFANAVVESIVKRNNQK